MKILVTALIFCILNASVFAKEKILDYFVIIDVQDDNSAIITERMIVNVETKKIKKGINKALPLDNDLMYKLISVKTGITLKKLNEWKKEVHDKWLDSKQVVDMGIATDYLY